MWQEVAFRRTFSTVIIVITQKGLDKISFVTTPTLISKVCFRKDNDVGKVR